MEDLETMVFCCHLLKRQVTMGAGKHWVFPQKSSNKKFICLYTSLRRQGVCLFQLHLKLLEFCKLLLLALTKNPSAEF